MPFREKTAWITLITVLLCFGVYFGALAFGLVRPMSWQSFHLGLLAIVGLVVLQVVLNIVAMAVRRRDERGPRDERERMIHARSHVIGYYVLMIGMAATLIVTHVHVKGEGYGDAMVRTVNTGVFAMALAALVVAVAQIVMFRRGS